MQRQDPVKPVHIYSMSGTASNTVILHLRSRLWGLCLQDIIKTCTYIDSSHRLRGPRFLLSYVQQDCSSCKRKTSAPQKLHILQLKTRCLAYSPPLHYFHSSDSQLYLFTEMHNGFVPHNSFSRVNSRFTSV